MNEYMVTVKDTLTIIELVDATFRMQVFKSADYALKGETAVIEATLYIEQGSYIPMCSYLFEVIDKAGEPLTTCPDMNVFKAAVDFFFNAVLNTDLYVKSIPKASALCPKQRKEFYYN